MPKRRNAFQDLIALIERQLAPSNATVTESAMVEAFGLSTMREVDVLIKGDFGAYQMKVAVEAKDERRKLDVTTLDAIVQKYRGECRVAVDRIIVVSRRGFSKGATEKAKALGVELLTLDEAKIKDWLSETPANVRFESKPHVCQVVFDPSPEGVEPTSLLSEGHIFCPHGHDHGSIREYANHVMFCHALLAEPGKGKLLELEEGISSSPEGEGTLTADFERQGWKVLYKGTEHSIEKMRVVLHAIAAKGEGSCKTYVRSSTDGSTRVFRHIEMTAARQRVSIVMPVDRGVPDKITLRLDSVHAHEKRNTASITSQQTKETQSD